MVMILLVIIILITQEPMLVIGYGVKIIMVIYLEQFEHLDLLGIIQ